MNRGANSSFGLYVHYPYCRRICPYCDFNVYGVRQRGDQAYFEALRAELLHRLTDDCWRDRAISSIYFGGGTPSLAPVSELLSVLQLLNEWTLMDAEISLEANPEDISKETALEWAALGINRVSLGMQGVQEQHLKTLGRRHSFEQVLEAITALQAAGLTNISVDYIFAVTGQTVWSVVADLQMLAALNLQHISAYELTIERGTPFYRLVKQAKLTTIDSDESAEQYSAISQELQMLGYQHYEVSNFALPGFASRHNLVYWRAGDYLGVGAGAHSFIRQDSKNGLRWSNLRTPNEYQSCAPRVVAWEESLSEQQLKFEYLLLGLRVLEGISMHDYQSVFGSSVASDFAEAIHDYQEQGLLQSSANNLRCTTEGRMLLDSIMSDARWKV